MDEDVALAPTADDNTGLAPEVRAELQSLAQGARETIGKKWSPHTHRAYAGAWTGSGSGPRAGDSRPAGRAGNSPAAPPVPSREGEGYLHHPDRRQRRLRGAPGGGVQWRQPVGPLGARPKDFLRGVEREARVQRQVAARQRDFGLPPARTPRRGRGGRMRKLGDGGGVHSSARVMMRRAGPSAWATPCRKP